MTSILTKAPTPSPGIFARSVRAKRAADIVIAGTLAVATLPLQGLLLVGSAVAFRAWPVFNQDRVGLDGKTFNFRKIRSLPTSAPSEADKYTLKQVKNHPFGHLIRKAHLDELLQFWSVLKGDMSMVGPRPEMLGLSESYPSEFVQARTAVRPGITGLWQISTGSQGLIGETPEFDLYYVQNPSWRLEAWIMIQTLAKMARHTMVELEDVPGFTDEGIVLDITGDNTIDITGDITGQITGDIRSPELAESA